MASIAEIMQLCRLCLVKEQVNVPIFEEQGDIRQIFLKITACLPVKISREDNLPKKICNGCLYKLELLYQFWNTSTNAEKQLLSWLTAAGLDATTQTTQDAMAVVTQTQVVLKQEPNPEITENVTVVSDPGNFILQAAQQPIEFPAVDFDYQDNFTAEQELANNAISADVDDSTESEPVAKRPRRTATATVTAPLIESEDDADDPGEAAVAAKTEEDSDDDTNVEPTFVDVAEDQDGEQPGPSGLGKIVEPSQTLAKEETYSDDVESENEFRRDPDYVSLSDLGSKLIKGKLQVKKKRAKRGTLEWKCKRCKDVTFNSKRLLRQHRIKAHPPEEQMDLQYNYTCLDGLYTCNTCDCSFTSKAAVEVHVLDHAEKLKCKVCSAAFTKLYELCIHSQVHNDKGWFQCDICEYKTKARSALLTHVNQFHLGKLRYTCEFCTKKFADILIYREHVEWHQTGQMFECIVCNRKFEYSRYLLLHQKRNHTAHIEGVIPPNQCPICKKSFAKSDTVIKHMKQHDKKGRMKLLCDLCGNSYNTKTKLKDHYRIHTGEKPYKCKDCGKSFSQRYYLTLHERMHTGVKPYTCEYCGKSFSQVTPLQVHKRSHTGEKPFTCVQCDRGFTSRGSLKTHLKRCSF